VSGVYRDKFAGTPVRVMLEEGSSHERLAIYPDEYFDILYHCCPVR
jgi:hypothetical protein